MDYLADEYDIDNLLSAIRSRFERLFYNLYMYEDSPYYTGEEIKNFEPIPFEVTIQSKYYPNRKNEFKYWHVQFNP